MMDIGAPGGFASCIDAALLRRFGGPFCWKVARRQGVPQEGAI
jgi:hypothetical protein